MRSMWLKIFKPFANAPQEEEDFQMIDLDTGEPVEVKRNDGS